MKSLPLVSVNMPVYNGERFIKEAIESILSQTFTDFELIIVNDGSTDKSEEIIKSFNDSRIRLFTNPVNSGLSRVRNQAINESKGEFIAILDCDDIATKDRLKLQVSFLNDNPKCSLVCSWTDIIDSFGNVIRQQCYDYSDEEISSALFFHNCIAQSSVMLRKSSLPSSCPYDPLYPPAEDYKLWIEMANKNSFHIIKKKLTQYRIHESNTLTADRSRTDELVRRLLQLQCNELGEKLSDEEINILLGVIYDCYQANYWFVPKLRNIFQKLISANRKEKKFKSKSFEKITKIYMQKVLIRFFQEQKKGPGRLKELFGKQMFAVKYLPLAMTIRVAKKAIFF